MTLSDTKVIETQFKILHRCYATNSIICKWDKTKPEFCNTCKQKSNILHNFVTCTNIQAFWKALETRITTHITDIDCTITAQDIILLIQTTKI